MDENDRNMLKGIFIRKPKDILEKDLLEQTPKVKKNKS